VHDTPWQDGSSVNVLSSQEEVDLIYQLRESQFSMAVIFTSLSQSPSVAAYLCYMAGIPYRVGFSKELGEGMLSHRLSLPPDETHQADRNLSLLEAIGIYS